MRKAGRPALCRKLGQSGDRRGARVSRCSRERTIQ